METIKEVHFQLTRQCNLRCWFCGQWGKKGFFSNASGTAMTYEDWHKVIVDLIQYSDQTRVRPRIMLWGGEPLIYPEFERLVQELVDNEFPLGMVTNGTLIDRHVACLMDNFDQIYISIDGPKDIHDSIRGKGVYEKVKQNLKLIKGSRAEKILMSVLSPQLMDELDTLPQQLSELYPDRMILQDMIVISPEEIRKYKAWMKRVFSIDAVEIDSWEQELSEEFQQKKKAGIRKILSQDYGFPVWYLPHGGGKGYCLSPFFHPHVTWNGNVMYCTDFYDFSAGSVRQEKLTDIFQNERSRRFRQEILSGNCPTCRHCSWKNNAEFQ